MTRVNSIGIGKELIMGATTIAKQRRLRDGYFEKYFVGQGVDMGCGDDPVTPDVLKYDIAYGHDAQNPQLPAESMDFVFSSHCLEHLKDPELAVRNWWNLVKPGGHLIVSVPDWTLYEQKVWPSVSNTDHKWTFSLIQPAVLPHRNHHVLGDLFIRLPRCQVLSLKLCDTNFNYDERRYDRTWFDKAEAEVEIVARKLTTDYWMP